MARLLRDALALDYAPDSNRKMLGNVSGIACSDGVVWTVSDEGRSLQRLEPSGNGLGKMKDFKIDKLIDNLPDDAETGKKGELDLEAIDVHDGALWLAGSHARVRIERKPETAPPDVKCRPRLGRCLFARIPLKDGEPGPGPRALPHTGDGALRPALEGDPWLHLFRDLPSKENGIDIEGMAIFDGRPILGLRGPLIDGLAVAVEVNLDDHAFKVRGVTPHFLDLCGLGIRDLARWRGGLAVLAGPTGPAAGPFALHYWRPDDPRMTAKPPIVFSWDSPTGGPSGKPEGICPDPKDDRRMIVVSDGRASIDGSVLMADVIEGL
jgi:hypothetical protein